MNKLNDVADFLYTNRAKNLPPSGLAEVFDRLIWCLNDNGAAILRIQREWLSSDDLDKIKIALAMDEVFPFESKEEMFTKLASISAKWPELRGQCEDVLRRWRTE